MVELLAAMKLYVSACDVKPPQLQPQSFTTDLVTHYKTPARAQIDDAQALLYQANRALECEHATQKMLDLLDKQK